MTEFGLTELVVLAFIGVGVTLMLIAAIGLLRMPDAYLRNSVASKGATLGVATLMLATLLYFGDWGIGLRALAVIVFMFLTAPVAAHMLGRAAYRSQVPFTTSTVVDADIDAGSLQQ